MSETTLVITNIGFPPLSARGCKQELIPIPNGELKKTVNGDLVFVKSSNIQKYKTTIRCSDATCPAMGNIWIGSTVNIACIQSIWQSYEEKQEVITLSRQPVDGSVIVLDRSGNNINHTIDGNEVSILDQKIDPPIFVSFRPWISAVITDFKTETDEWELTSNWTLSAEEV